MFEKRLRYISGVTGNLEISLNSLVQALGQESRQPSQTKTVTEITCKNFGNKLEPKKKNLFRCATHNINNIPELGRTMKSKEITAGSNQFLASTATNMKSPHPGNQGGQL